MITFGASSVLSVAPLLVPLQLGLRSWDWGREGFPRRPETGAHGNISWCEAAKEGERGEVAQPPHAVSPMQRAWFSLRSLCTPGNTWQTGLGDATGQGFCYISCTAHDSPSQRGTPNTECRSVCQ